MIYNIHRLDEITSNRRRGYKFLFHRVNKKLVLRFALLVQCTTGLSLLLSFESQKQKCILETSKHGFEYPCMPLKINWTKRAQLRQNSSYSYWTNQGFSPRVFSYHFSSSSVEQRCASEYLQQNGNLAHASSSFIQRNQTEHNVCLKLYIYWNKLNQHSVITFKFRTSSAMEIRLILHIGLGYE